MRNALNALQSTVSGFGIVTMDNVFKVCDQPHPKKIKIMIDKILQGKTKEAQDVVVHLYNSGYAATDIIQTIFRVTKAYEMPEPQKLEYVREIGFTHLRISEGLNSLLQLLGCVARLSAMVHKKLFPVIKIANVDSNQLIPMDV